MSVIEKNVKFCKELDEVAELPAFMIGEVRRLKAEGKGTGEIISALGAGSVGKIITALDKVDQIDDEYEEDRKAFMATAGYRSGELVDALMPAKTKVVRLDGK